MTIQSDMALMAAGSYWDVRKGEVDPQNGIDTDNDAPVPAGWKVLTEYDTSNTGGIVFFRNGFSARVYQNISTNEIVISYAGTEFGLGRAGFYNDFLSGNIPLALGLYGDQALQAAQLYQRVWSEKGGNIAFTGHSLGGGLASVMAVWFDRPAYVFAPAPFEKSADTTQPTGLLVQILGIGVMPTVQRLLGSSIDPAFRDYDPASQYATRETKVKAWAVQGEVLEAELNRFAPTFVRWIESAPRTPLFQGMVSTLSAGDRHSIDLHAAALLSPTFEIEAARFTNALPLLFSSSLYGGDVLGNQQLILTKLVRNEVGVRDDATGNVLLAANGMLSNFAADFQKLGTNIAGLNRAAQDAILAQGISARSAR